MDIDLNKPREEIINEFIKDILNRYPEATREEAEKYAIKSMPFLKCPMVNNNRISPTNCFFCAYGHLTECHFPQTCEEANCLHYQRDNYYDGGDKMNE